MRNRVLVVDRAPNLRRVIVELLSDEGFDVIAADGTDDAVARARTFSPMVTVLGLESSADLPTVRQLAVSSRQVIAVAPFGGVQLGIAAMDAGASDYILKPLLRAELLLVIGKAIEQFELVREVTELRHERGR